MSKIQVDQITNSAGNGPVDFPLGVAERLSAGSPALLDAAGRIPAARLPVTVDVRYRGVHDASTGAYPADPAEGDMWIIAIGGTLGGVVFAQFDRLVYTVSGWGRIPKPSEDAIYLRRDFEGSLYLEKTATVEFPISPSLLIGGSFSFVWRGRISQLFTASSFSYANIFGCLKGVALFYPGCLSLAVRTSDRALAWINTYGNATTGDWHRLHGPSIAFGESATVVGTFDADTQVASLYVNGQLAASDAWANANFDTARKLKLMADEAYEDHHAAGYTEHAAIYNLVLPAADIAAISGPQPTLPRVPPVYRWAGPRVGSIDWAVETYPWTSLTIDGQNGFDGVAGASSRAALHSGVRVINGDRLRIEFDYVLTGGGAYSTALRLLRNASASAASGSEATSAINAYSGLEVPGTIPYLISDGVEHHAILDVLITIGDSTRWLNYVFNGLPEGAELTVSSFKAVRLGVLGAWSAAQDSRHGWQLHDLHPDGRHGLLSATGVTWTDPGERGRLTLSGAVADAWLSGSARVLIPAGVRLVEVIATETAGNAAANLALGTTANGSDIVASFSLAANETKRLDVTGAFVAKTTAQPVHINDAPAGGSWGGASIDLTFIFERF